MRNRRLPVMQASKPAASKCRSWHWSARNTCAMLQCSPNMPYPVRKAASMTSAAQA